MFGKRHRKGDSLFSEQKLSCSFCKKTQDDVRKLIAGPSVYICDDCVQVCVDIITHDGLVERGATEQVDPVVPETPRWSASARCTLCRLPVIVEEALNVESRALLCRACVSAVQAAAAQAEETAQP